MLSIYFVRQNITSQPVQSLNSDSATFSTDGSETPLLKPEDDTVDQFVYEHSYCVDEKQTTNQVFYINIIKSEISNYYHLI